jgi:hypothetical protein
MNELLMRRYVKKVMSCGVPKYMAQEIVEGAMSVSKGTNLDKAVDYAMTLTYGLKFSKKA